jgi:hypothetical protein
MECHITDSPDSCDYHRLVLRWFPLPSTDEHRDANTPLGEGLIIGLHGAKPRSGLNRTRYQVSFTRRVLLLLNVFAAC